MRSGISFLLVLIPALGACASHELEGYPSLAIRDVERVSGQMEAAEGAPYVPPPPSAAVLGELNQLVADANDAHREFQSAADRTRRLVSAASGASVGAESWAQAQVALASLELSRARAMVALADLDRLYVDAATGGAETQDIGKARDQVGSLVEAENAVINSLISSLP